MTAPPITPETFPYRRKWTQSQLDEILGRYQHLVSAMTDAVGPTGQVLYLPADQIHILALHLALAGGHVDDRLAYIVAKPFTPVTDDADRATRDNGHVVFADITQWVLKSEYEPAPPDPNEVNAQARAAADKIRRQLSPQMTEAVMAILAEQSQTAATKPAAAEATSTEAEMRDRAGEDGDA